MFTVSLLMGMKRPEGERKVDRTRTLCPCISTTIGSTAALALLLTSYKVKLKVKVSDSGGKSADVQIQLPVASNQSKTLHSNRDTCNDSSSDGGMLHYGAFRYI